MWLNKFDKYRLENFIWESQVVELSHADRGQEIFLCELEVSYILDDVKEEIKYHEAAFEREFKEEWGTLCALHLKYEEHFVRKLQQEKLFVVTRKVFSEAFKVSTLFTASY